jgi:hypothetical protein
LPSCKLASTRSNPSSLRRNRRTPPQARPSTKPTPNRAASKARFTRSNDKRAPRRGRSESKKQQRDALAEVARAVLSARGSIAVSEPMLDALRRHDKSVEAAALRLETHLRALDAYDRERVKQGVVVVLSALGIVVLSILLKAVL